MVFSVALCTKFGVTGILVGTVIAQFWFWIGRSRIVYKYCFKMGKYEYLKYLAECFRYVMVTGVATVLSRTMYSYLHIANNILLFLAGGVVSVLICLIVYLLFFAWSSNFKMLIQLVKRK